MFHPDILRQYLYRRNDVQIGALDSCVDTAEYFGIPIAAFSRFLVTMGIDANRLQLLV